MHVSRVSVGFTKNLGNFQSARVDVAVDLTAEDDPDVALMACNALVNDALDMDVDPASARAAQLLSNKRYEVVEG